MKTYQFGNWKSGNLIHSGEATFVYRSQPRGAVIKWLKGGKLPRGQKRVLQHEVSLLSDFDHPNIPKFLGEGSCEDRPYMVLSDAGVPLRTLGRLKVADALYVVGEILRGLHYLHKHDILFLNLRPAHVLVGSDGSITLVDFGCACTEDDVPQLPTFYDYLSPEQARRDDLEPESDQYGAALLLLELLTGASAYARSHGYEALNIAASGLSAQEIRARMGAVTDPNGRLTDILLQALARTPYDRFSTCLTFTKALTRVLNSVQPGYTGRDLARLVNVSGSDITFG